MNKLDDKIPNLPKDMEPLFGLWAIFELKKMDKRYQNKVLNDIKNGIYPRNESYE
jgi:hypothetical protein